MITVSVLNSLTPVTTVIGMIAFVAALVSGAYGISLRFEQRRLRTLPEEQRLTALLAMAGRYQIEINKLDGPGIERIVLIELSNRLKRFRLSCFTALGMSVIILGAALLSTSHWWTPLKSNNEGYNDCLDRARPRIQTADDMTREARKCQADN